MLNRKDFFKHACITGACLCGFGQLAMAKEPQKTSEPDSDQLFLQDWLASLLKNLEEIKAEEISGIIKKNGLLHYNFLKLDTTLSEFGNDIQKFTNFLETQWGWKITCNMDEKTIIADENKNFCVCPIAKKINQKVPVLCNCSEGIAEKMFSKILGKDVKAKVISSVQRGDKTCKYKIVW